MDLIAEAQIEVEPELDEVLHPRLDPKPSAPAGQMPRKAPVRLDHAPALGTKFTYKGMAHVVTGYMRAAPRAPGVFGKRDSGIVACHPGQAEYVIGMGGHGCVAPIGDIVPTGEQADWTPEQRQHVERTAMKLIDQGYTIKRPFA
jgi:hypothetical protein